MAKTGKIFLIFIFLFISVTSFAAVTVQSLVDRNEMGMGDTLTLTVSVSSGESVQANEPRLANLENFDLVNSWTSNSSSSKLMQGAGGMQFETVRRYDFNYMITPKKVGTLSIPSIEVTVDGKVYNTKPVNIKVSAQGSGATQRPNRGQHQDEESEEEQIFNQLLQQRSQLPAPGLKGLPKNVNEALSVQVELDKTEVYEGEQIVANWYIYTRGNLLSLDRLKFPDLKGFWKEIIEEVPALNFTQEVVNGISYRKALLASHALFPIKAGTSVVDEYKIKGTIQIPSNPFSSFGGGQAYSFNRSSDRVKIKVKPLPTEGKPQDFSGAVGQFEVQAIVEGKQFPVNQPFSLKVRFEGTGNAKLIELPSLNLPKGVEVYDTKAESKFFKNGRSYKEFEVLIIPREEGEIQIPAMSFSIFDPKIEKYVKKNTAAIDLKILPNNNVGNLNSNRVSAEKNSTVAENKKEELPNIVISWKASGQQNSIIYLISLYILVISALGWKTKKEFNWGKRKKDLNYELQKRLKKVHAAVDKSDWRSVGTQMTNLFYHILGEVSGLGGANKEISKLLDEAPPSLRRELGPELSKYIEIFQVMSFAPESVVGPFKEKEQMKKNIQEAESVLKKSILLSESSK